MAVMKTFMTICLFSSYILSYSQQSINFNAVEKRVRTANASDPETLSRQLTSGLQNDQEKVRAIFRWITENISYKLPARNYRWNRASYEEMEEDTGALKPLNDRVGERVLLKKEAFCDGYSRLFQSLCDFAGVTCVTIVGYGRGGWNTKGIFKANHSWNAVMLDSSWYLLDVTWASGFISVNTGQFIKHYDESYFLAKPEVFIRDHFPDQIQWTLLQNPPLYKEFNKTPFYSSAYTKYSFSSHFPAKGLIDVSIGDTLRIVLEKKREPEERRIAPDFNYDSTLFNQANDWVFLKPDSVSDGDKVVYTYVVTGKVEWLHLLYNEDMVLRYKLNCRKENEAVVSR